MAFSMKPYLLATVLFTAPLFSVQAHAFDYGYKADNYFATYHIDDSFNRTLYQNQRKYGTGYKKAKQSSKSTKSTTSKSTTKTTKTTSTNSNAHRYTPSASVSTQINRQMVQALRSDLQAVGRLNSQSEQELNALAQANLIGQVKNALKSDGYEPNSLATAMGFWVVVNYGISEQKDLSRLKAHTMVKQLQASIATTELASLSNSEKQLMAENLYWAGTLQMGMYLQAVQAGNRQYINQSVSTARQALSKMGVSASQIKQGSGGLEFR